MLLFGGAIEFSYRDRSKVDVDRAMAAIARLYGDSGAWTVMDGLLNSKTKSYGGTFTGSKEDCDEAVKLLEGTGVEAEVLKPAHPQAMIDQMRRYASREGWK